MNNPSYSICNFTKAKTLSLKKKKKKKREQISKKKKKKKEKKGAKFVA